MFDRCLTLLGLVAGFIGALCAYVDSRHVASGFSAGGVRLGLGKHDWLWWHWGEIGFVLIALAFALEIAAWMLRHNKRKKPSASND